MFEINVKVTLDASPALVKTAEVLATIVQEQIPVFSYTATSEPDEAITETAVSEDLPFDPEPEPDKKPATSAMKESKVDTKARVTEALEIATIKKDEGKRKEIKALLQKWGYKSISVAAQSGDGEAILAELRGL